MSATTPETTTRLLAHEVDAVHATTGAPVPVTATFEQQPPRGWALKQADASRIVVTRDATSRPTVPRLRLSATTRERLAAPDVVLDLVAPATTHAFTMAPATLEVQLVLPTGMPSAAAVVTVKPSAGAAVALPEAAPGRYRSPERVWGAEFHPLDIRVDDTTLRRVALDLTKRVTHVRLVNPL